MCAFICKKHEGLVPQKNMFYFFCIFDLLSKKLENQIFVRVISSFLKSLTYSALPHITVCH